MGKSLYQVKLEARKRKDKKDSIITDMDYVLRDKDEKDVARNTRDMTPDGVVPGSYEAKHKEEVEKLKDELKKATEVKEETSARDKEIDELKAQIAALAQALEPKEDPKPTATKAKATGAK